MKMKRTRLNIILTLLLVFMMVPVNAFALGDTVESKDTNDLPDITGMDFSDSTFRWNAVTDATTYTVVLNDYANKTATASTVVGTFIENSGVFNIEDSDVTPKLTRYHYYTITVTANGINSSSEATTLTKPTTSTYKYYYNNSAKVINASSVELKIRQDDQVIITNGITDATDFIVKLYKTKHPNYFLDSNEDVILDDYTKLLSTKYVNRVSGDKTTADFDYDEFDYETGSDARNNYFVEIVGTKTSSTNSSAIYSPIEVMTSSSKGTLQKPVFEEGLTKYGYVRLDGSNNGTENVESIILQVWEKDGSNIAVKKGLAAEITKSPSSSSDISYTFNITRKKDCYYYASAIYFASGWENSISATSNGFISDVTDDDNNYDNNYDDSSTNTSAKLSTPNNLRWSGDISTWSDISNADAYEVSKYVDGSQVGPSKIVTNNYITFKGLSKSGNYTFKVKALSYDNNYSNSNTTFSPTKIVTSTIAQPGAFKINKAKKTSSTVKLYWSKSANVDVYRIYKKVNGNYKMYIKSVRGTATAKTITGLQSGTAHYFKVKAVNSGLYVYSNAKKATTYSY